MRLDKKIEQLQEKREKHKAVIQVQTEQLRKVEEDINVLEAKKKDRLLKNLLSNLQKEGLNFDKKTVGEIVNILKEKQHEENPDAMEIDEGANHTSSEFSRTDKEKNEDKFIS
ncbi:MAG: hypothetical protein H6Q70_62 [Firmicutes bacterium]|nr:hypothetical protein [Bacillota bacterium]